MNQRIKELAEKSGAWEYYEINEGVNGDEKPLEKFAELIVRECAQFTDSGIRKFLLKHFGLEE